MTEAIVAPIFTHLAKITKEGVRLVGGVEQEIEKLESEFKSIKAVVVDAEKRQVKEESVRVWLEKVRDVSSETEEILKEWITATEKAEITGHGRQSSLLKKVCRFINLPCLHCNRISHLHDIALKIKKVNERLGYIAIEKERYQFNDFTGSGCPPRRKTTSFIRASEVKGRDEEMKTIMSKMFSDNNRLNIVSIVGVEGIGKTTLAQLVYNCSDVKRHFDVRIWVCASGPFHEIEIAKAILECVTDNGNDSNLFELETIAGRIRDHVEGKKFLLVLDDVYIDDFREWEQLFNSLGIGAAGSTILVTTKEKKAAIAMRSSYQLPLKKLSPDDSWHLFEETTFLEQNKAQWGRLENFWTSDIAKKCNGSPLFIKNIGIKMLSKEPRDWHDVLNKEFPDLEFEHCRNSARCTNQNRSTLAV